MATISEGMTIQATWFANIDSTGSFIKDVNFVNTSDPIHFVQNSVNLIQLETDGDLRVKGDITDNETI